MQLGMRARQMISGGSNAARSGKGCVVFSILTRQVLADGPCATAEVGRSGVTAFGFPCRQMPGPLRSGAESNQDPVSMISTPLRTVRVSFALARHAPRTVYILTESPF